MGCNIFSERYEQDLFTWPKNTWERLQTKSCGLFGNFSQTLWLSLEGAMLETWDLSDIMSEWWVNWLFQLEAYPAYASSELNKFIILNTHLILRRREIRGRGRLSVGRDPETCSVKILPNQRGLHPKCRPTVLCQLQSVHWLACPLPKLQNYNHNYQNMRGNRCQVIPKWPSSDPRDRNMQLILSDCCTTIQLVLPPYNLYYKMLSWVLWVGASG